MSEHARFDLAGPCVESTGCGVEKAIDSRMVHIVRDQSLGRNHGDGGRKWISQARRDWCQPPGPMTKPDSSGTHSRAASRLATRDPA